MQVQLLNKIYRLDLAFERMVHELIQIEFQQCNAFDFKIAMH